MAKAAARSGVVRFAARFARPRVAILMYHTVQDQPELTANIIDMGMPTALFERQMGILARHYDPVTVDDVLAFLNGTGRLPRRAVVVTFDDGFADNAEVAAPIMERYGIRGAFYLTAGLIGTKNFPWYCRLRYAFRTTEKAEWGGLNGALTGFGHPGERESALQRAWDYCAALTGSGCAKTVATIEGGLGVVRPEANIMLTWDQARRLLRAGHVVGSHTVWHPNMAYLAAEDALREFTESKKLLEEQLKAPVLHFSYPHAALERHLTWKTIDLSAQAGYRTAMTTLSGPVAGGDNPLALRRVQPAEEEYRFRGILDCALCGVPYGFSRSRS
jgi:peptidoglycan/xylan/chitin deacetylase (PgdA/CDA1 family)